MMIPARIDMYKGVYVPFFIDENCRLFTNSKNITKAFKADGSLKPEKPNPGNFNLPFAWEATYKIGDIQRKDMMIDEYGIVLLAFICLQNPTEFLQWLNEICIDSRRNPHVLQGYQNMTWPRSSQFAFAQAVDIPPEKLFNR